MKNKSETDSIFMAQAQLPPTFQERDLNYYLRMIRGDYSTLEEMQPQPISGSTQVKNIVIVFTSETIGKGSETLGKKLILLFLQSLINGNVKPKAIIFMNSGVKLVCSQNEYIGKLTVLEEQGSKIMACISSLEEYGLLETLSVGFEASMDEMCESMITALKVITF